MEASTEEWRPVLRYKGLYEISDQGRVRSIDRIELVTRNGREFTRRRDGRLLRISPNKFDGRPQAGLSKNGKLTTIYVHRLVLEAFIGPRPKGLECCHEDGDRMNNRLSNLRWDTHASNEADKHRHGTALSKLTMRDVDEIRQRYAKGTISQRALGREYGISKSAIYRALH